MRSLLGRGRLTLASLAALGLIAAGAGFAFASAPITASPNALAYGGPTFTIDQGEVAVFQNTGFTAHNVSDYQKEGYFFRSPPSVAPGTSADVEGTQYLTSGTYPFYCKIHGPTMSANLVITTNGQPQARPRVSLKVLSSSIAKVRSSRKLKVKVTAITDSPGIEVESLKGNTTVTTPAKLDLSAGASRVVTLRVKRSRTGLLAGDSVKLRIYAFAAFGNGVSAVKTLH